MKEIIDSVIADNPQITERQKLKSLVYKRLKQEGHHYTINQVGSMLKAYFNGEPIEIPCENPANHQVNHSTIFN